MSVWTYTQSKLVSFSEGRSVCNNWVQLIQCIISKAQLLLVSDFWDFWSDFWYLQDLRTDFWDFKDLKYFNGSRHDFKEFRSGVRNFSDLKSAFTDFVQDLGISGRIWTVPCHIPGISRRISRFSSRILDIFGRISGIAGSWGISCWISGILGRISGHLYTGLQE